MTEGGKERETISENITSFNFEATFFIVWWNRFTDMLKNNSGRVVIDRINI